MKKLLLSPLCYYLLLPLLFLGCAKEPVPGEESQSIADVSAQNQAFDQEIVAVANRGSASISFIDATTNAVINTLDIPDSEPMYIVFVPAQDRLYVGDRAQNQVHVIDPETMLLESSIDVGNGVFHMWADGSGKRLWVNNDIDQTTSVIDLDSGTVVGTIDIGHKPHDVFLTRNGSRGYISVLNDNANLPDSIYMYNATTLQRMQATAVGKDPHLYHITRGNSLYVPCQSGQLFELNGGNLSVRDEVALEGAHGIYATPSGRNLFVSNISGSRLYSIDTSNNQLIGDPFVSSLSIPHNLVLNAAGDKLFVTHSNATAYQVTIYTVSGIGTLTYQATKVVGSIPFGLAYYAR